MPDAPAIRPACFLHATLGAGSARRDDHARHGEHDQAREGRVDGHEQPDGDHEAGDRSDLTHERAVEVVQQEDLIAQELEAIQVRGTLVVLDARGRRLQPRHVCFELDRGPVAEARLHARAERAHEPAANRRGREAGTRPRDERRLPRDDAVGEVFEPERAERVGQCGARDQHEGQDQQSRLGTIGEPERAHQRAPCGREVRVVHADAQDHSAASRRSSAASCSSSKRDACRSNIVR